MTPVRLTPGQRRLLVALFRLGGEADDETLRGALNDLARSGRWFYLSAGKLHARGVIERVRDRHPARWRLTDIGRNAI